MNALIFTTILGIIILYLGLTKNKKILAPAGIAGLLVTLFLSFNDWGLGSAYFHNMVVFDNFSIAFNISMIIITIILVLGIYPQPVFNLVEASVNTMQNLLVPLADVLPALPL